MPFRSLISATALTATTVLVLGTAACNGLPEDLDRTIEQTLDDWKVAGLAVAVVKDGRAEYLKGYGHRDINTSDLVDEHTIFGLGSTSKAFGAAVIGMLVDEGALDWDDRVVDHLPEFQVADSCVTRELTVRDLLCHRSGVESNNIIFFSSASRDEIVGKARLLRQVAGLRSRFGYHNLMILTAGQVAARVTGKSWDDVAREKIFQPLAMGRTSTSISALDDATNVASPHTVRDGALVTVPWLDVDSSGPAGCVNSCAADMAKWLQVHLAEGAFRGKQVWSAQVQQTMFAPHTIMDSRMAGRLAEHARFGLYGLGWMMNDYRGHKFVYHGGATDGMGAFVGLVPEERLGVVVLQNTSQNPLPELLGYHIIDVYLGVPKTERTDLRPAPMPVRPGPRTREAATGTAPSLPLGAYTGVYFHPMYEHVEVTLSQGSLVLSFDLYPTATLEHVDQDRFTMRFERSLSSMWDRIFGPELEATFHLGDDSAVSTLTIQHFGDFTRIESGSG